MPDNDLQKSIARLERAIANAKSPSDLDNLQDLFAQLDKATEQVEIEAARESPDAFIEYVFRDKNNNKLKQAEFHNKWQRQIHHPEWNPNGHRRAMIIAPRDHGKCQIRGNRVLCANGSLVNIEDWDGGQVLAYDIKTGKLVPTYSPPSYPNGVQPTLRIQTKSGRVVTVTHNHPLRTWGKWDRADGLTVGQRIAVPRRYVLPGATKSVSGAWLLGVLVGDGGTSQPNSVLVTKNDLELIQQVEKEAELRGWEVLRVVPGKPTYRINKSKATQAPWDWCAKHGLQGKTSPQKRVPSAIFTADNHTVSEFLSGYLDTDAHVNMHAGGAVEFYSVSEGLLRDVQHLLLRLSICSVLTRKRGKHKGEVHWSWRLTIRGKDILSLARAVVPRGKRAQQLVGLVTLQEGKTHSSGKSIDRFPREVLDLVQHGVDWFRRYGHSRPNKQYEPTREKLERIATAEGNKRLLTAVDSDVLWDEILSIEDAGEQETWSMHVPGYVNYVSNDIVNHNTTQIPVGRVLWELGRNPNLRIKIVCQSDSKAIERLFEIKDNLDRNERVKKVFPHLIPAQHGDWTKHKIVVKRELFSKDASIEALGILSTATGGRCDLLIADDIVDRRNAIQFPQIRETIKHAWKSDWTNLLEPDGRIVYICTLWHTDDNSHHLMDNTAYACLFYAVNDNIEEFDVEYRVPGKDRTPKKWTEELWNAHWHKNALLEREEEIGAVEFNRAFRNQALSGEIIVVQPDSIKYFDPLKIPEHVIPYSGYDLAISKKKQSDYFASVQALVDFDAGKIYIWDGWHGKLSFQQQAQSIVEEYIRGEHEEVIIEAVAYQESLPQYLDSIAGKRFDHLGWREPESEFSKNGSTILEFPDQDKRFVPQLPIVRVTPRHDKMSRLKWVTPNIERGQVLFHPRLNPERPGFVKERGDLVGELTKFPLARNDDLVDAFVNVVRRAVIALAQYERDEDERDELEVGVRVIGG